MTKPNLDLLYVEDINPFCLAARPDTKPEEISSNYGQLAGRGVELSDRVLLLSSSRLIKIIGRRGVLEGGYQNDVHPYVQFVRWMKKEFEEAYADKESLFLSLNAFYREAAAKLQPLASAITMREGTLLSALIANLGHINVYEEASSIIGEDLEKIDDEELKKVAERTKKQVDLTVETIRRHLNSEVRKAEELAEHNNTYSVSVHPTYHDEIPGSSQVILVEEPLSPGKPIYEDVPEEDSRDGVFSQEFFMQQKRDLALIETAAKLSTRGVGSLEEALQKIPNPRLVLTDVYARMLFPELDERFDVNILNATVDVKGLPCYKIERRQDRVA